jgi:hypothetical protein
MEYLGEKMDIELHIEVDDEERFIDSLDKLCNYFAENNYNFEVSNKKGD